MHRSRRPVSLRPLVGLLALTLGVWSIACGSDATSTGSTSSGGGASTGAATASGTSTGAGQGGGQSGDFVVGGARPVTVHVPPSYSSATPAPLVIMLHGYSGTANIEEAYLKIGPAAAAHGILYAYPDGTVDTMGLHFWNATDACCNFYGSTVDDSAYLKGLIDEVKQKANVDPKRVYFIGHSNGGFMSYRMACDHADDIAAIASLAGATFANQSDCKPSSPVAVLEIHGTGDGTIDYNGGTLATKIFPSAQATVGTWAAYDGCSAVMDTSLPPHDLDNGIQGTNGPAEATVISYSAGCKPGGHAELWTIPGGVHIPAVTPTFGEQVITFLLANPKP